MDVRAAQGRTARLVWCASHYLTDAAELVVHHPTAGDVQPPFTVAREAVTVDAVAPDRRTLTLTDPIPSPAPPVAGDEGDAFLRLPDGGVIPVTVQAIDGATVTLADTIHRPVAGVAAETPATLQWAAWVGVLDDELTATLRRNIPWTVTASGLGVHGAIPIEAPGLLHVVRRPFSTGITLGDLHRFRPALAEAQYRRATHRDAIDDGMSRLVAWLRADLGAGLFEDDVFNGHDFRRVHLRLAEAALNSDPEVARGHLQDARELYRTITERVLLDRNQDGIADAAEQDLGGADDSHMGYGGMGCLRQLSWRHR